ncbi:MAG: YdeI/OmpD-associated family protein [Flavobacteriales bacterium]|nr:YdeI/OmpD-associated family protein [Bacteroidota bacterium]MCB9241222.1 YdeI/OmpD-associated family protein [Flavobacteriales bacterium]
MSGALNPQVDLYLEEGCGRCDLYQTPHCKVHTWGAELIQLRMLVLESGLMEEFKWKQPTYTLDGKNVLMVTAFKDYACISFFKGVLLDDPNNLLEFAGENSQSGKLLKCRSVDFILEWEPAIRELIQQAIATEQSGKKVELKPMSDYDVPEELQNRLDDDPFYRAAFEALTPGRKRSYYLYIGGAKQSATRDSRVDKSLTKILQGKGWNEY